MLTLDGRTGEGGGQLVRIAVALAALTGQPLRVINVRGNRRFGGGLKPQHVAAVDWLAAATHATLDGVRPGSTTFTFKPRHVLLPHDTSPGNPIILRAATPAASTSLMLQAVLPYLLFARPGLVKAGGVGPPVPAAPVSIDLYGGTHVSFAPTFDYLDQVLFPTLEDWFGVRVERELVQAGWGTGPKHAEAGVVRLVVHPIISTTTQAAAVEGANAIGELIPRMPTLFPNASEKSNQGVPVITAIDATVLAPADLLDPLAGALAHEVAHNEVLSPDPTALTVDLQFQRIEESGHDSRVYVLLVARTYATDGGGGTIVRRWGRDYLGTETIKRGKTGGGGGGSGKMKGAVGKRGAKGRKAETSTDLGALEGGGFSLLCDRIARRVVLDLAAEVSQGGCGDAYLQDQVVVFQALAAGQTGFWRGSGAVQTAVAKEEVVEKLEQATTTVVELQEAVEKLHLQGVEGGEKAGTEEKEESTADNMAGPFGQGSMHAATARWVTAQILPAVRWSDNGTVCNGVGWAGKK
ncbi:hypothetical protein SCUCBS95973_006910 [Sporothrix curviconia]|uniref:RNA 3'-terminal phosphate cyclase domain-containing protein n=1 Tax=Sporothrix curviconia TaxID=1260050 RepID=A0ABP0C9C8_9PEZI